MTDSTVTFAAVPPNLTARKRIARAARLGLRTTRSPVDYGDAARCVDAARAYKAGWESSAELFPTTVRAAWAGR